MLMKMKYLNSFYWFPPSSDNFIRVFPLISQYKPTENYSFCQFSIFKRSIVLKRFIWNNYNCPFGKKFP